MTWCNYIVVVGDQFILKGKVLVGCGPTHYLNQCVGVYVGRGRRRVSGV